MRAIVYKHYGSPDVLRLEEVEKPVPGDDELRIKVHAAEATKSDCEMRSFQFAVNWFWLPLRITLGISKPRRQILGGYFSGEVDTIGKNVTGFKPGQRVFGSSQLRLGAYGEYLCLPASYTIVPMPDNASFAEAAAVPLGGLNALHYLRRANIQPGEKVLVNGAGASIGTFAVQIAKTLGAEVTAIDAGHKQEMLQRIGADHFIDYQKEGYSSLNGRYDVIFSMVAGSSYSESLKMLEPGGRYLMANPRASDMLRSTFTTRFTDKSVIFGFAGETKEELLALKALIEEGAIKSVVDEVYPLEQVAQAHRRVETEQRLGSVVLAVVDKANAALIGEGDSISGHNLLQ